MIVLEAASKGASDYVLGVIGVWLIETSASHGGLSLGGKGLLVLILELSW